MYRVLCDGKILHDIRDPSYVLVSPKLTLELNKTGSFTFTILPTHPHANDIKRMISRIEVYEGDELLYVGRSTTDEEDFQLTGQATCEGDLAYLLDSIQEKHSYGSQSAEINTADTNVKIFPKLIEMHNIQVGAEKRFTCGQIDIDEEDVKLLSTNFERTWDFIDSNFLQKYTGYLRTRHDKNFNYIDYVKQYGRVSDQTIRFGENLLDIQKYVQTEDVRTAILPMGANGVTVKTATGHDGTDYVRDQEAIDTYGWIAEKVDFSDINSPDELLKEAKKYLAKHSKPTVSIELTALDLHMLDADISAFRLGDLVPVISDLHRISSTIGDVSTYYPISKYELDLENPANSKITLGATRPTLSSQMTFGFSSGRSDAVDIKELTQEDIDEICI